VTQRNRFRRRVTFDTGRDTYVQQQFKEDADINTTHWRAKLPSRIHLTGNIRPNIRPRHTSARLFRPRPRTRKIVMTLPPRMRCIIIRNQVIRTITRRHRNWRIQILIPEKLIPNQIIHPER